MSFRVVCVFALVAITVMVTPAMGACPNIKGKLMGFDHMVAGSLSISKSCALTVKNFSYDGQAPKVFWWAAPSCKPADIVSKGYRISNTQVTMAYSGSTYSVKLNKPVRRAGCIILYCEDFNADLGHLVVKKSG